jgi:hypothetical protein
MDALRPLLWDAERPGLHSHAERGNDHAAKVSRRFCICGVYPRFLPNNA